MEVPESHTSCKPGSLMKVARKASVSVVTTDKTKLFCPTVTASEAVPVRWHNKL